MAGYDADEKAFFKDFGEIWNFKNFEVLMLGNWFGFLDFHWP